MLEIWPTETRTQAYTHARARSTYAAEHYQHFGRSLVPFSSPRLLGPGGQVRAATPSASWLIRFFPFQERGHMTSQRRRNCRLPGSNSTVCMLVSYVCQTPILVCVRRLVRRWNAPVLLAARMDGFVFAI